ncbi:MAG: mandelate racemase/muconate lactonizing enzyme family protein [Methylocystis sp.]|nr:mandelate racemase/muconate lactonizing enzyme family protein [Methylocystis sp.]MCA3582261.1 mandelate racemase/muconate lactonizing enzyme family protein [Methylocystis sp.]MCA3588156.1 mandelate racemase/muconate lactonizing enzyme family protein [Methylocystis sp.]MCA3590074.1 mandelate racemase/muconate lactonizing enzyme family protein [Methylocystis sp.]
MAKITRIEAWMIDLKPKVKRTDAIQSFVSQETPMVRITDSDGASGIGYTYTIGTGGPSIMKLLEHTLLPALIGRDAGEVERIWRDLLFLTHATTVGAITSLALAAIDTALWDLRCRKAGLPLHVMAGGAQESVPLYTTEGGWLHLSPEELVDDALKARADGFRGAKIKIGRPHVREDVARLAAVRAALGDGFEIMTDANQAFQVDEAIRRARHYEPLDIAWFEEPLTADDLSGHQRLCASTSIPVAVGESLYSPLHFREYLQRNACSVVQVDVARIGGITPWLKVAHLAEAFNMPVCPHFLMELHVALCCAAPNARWVEYIPQLDTLTTAPMARRDGRAFPSPEPGIGIAWDAEMLEKQTVPGSSLAFG